MLLFYMGSKWPAARTSALHFLPGLIYHILFLTQSPPGVRVLLGKATAQQCASVQWDASLQFTVQSSFQSSDFLR